MADGKKSFVLYCDMIHTVDLLDDALAGKLLKHLLHYVNDDNPHTDDILLKVAFEPIKRHLKRDLKDWEETREKRVYAGKKGGIKSGESRKRKAKEANASKTKQAQANEAVNGNVNGNVTVSVNNLVNDAEKEILKNQNMFEQLCSTRTNNLEEGKESLRNFHLFLVQNEKYPQSKKQIWAGFERWLMNEKKFKLNGKQRTNGTGTVGKTIEFDNL